MKSPFISRLMDEEIRRIVADALNDGGVVSASEAAATIMVAYPNSGLSEADIANEIMMAASAAGIAVQIGPSSNTVTAGLSNVLLSSVVRS